MTKYLTIEGRQVPEPNFDRDVERLMGVYRRAYWNVKLELNRVDLIDFQRSSLIATMKKIEEILNELDRFVINWASTTIPEVVKQGVASVLVELGVTNSYKESLQMATFNRINKSMVDLFVSDTSMDVLEVSKNVRRRVRNTIRKVSGEVMRNNMARGVNGQDTQSRMILQRLRKELSDSVNTGIIDAGGRRWKPVDYVDMLTRTKYSEMYRIAKTNEAIGREAYYGIIVGGSAKDACRFHVGRIIKLTPESPGDYPTYEDLKASNQIFHPRCVHHFTTFSKIERLPEDVRQTAEEQHERGNVALESGKRNP
ncbi:phage minor capsid protein [Thermoactinomyces sp. DSM 45892]|uniref:phage minor capsid protein n=1 Tax=Thermoactinomyces sp. DSM 45892 TaxID=1882753 RepID=UPI00089A2000|nr:phage minor capsid protein [Thermoactinomyces sp. DSM 45892]SDZ05012.1 Phage minor capsid protein 2 [Thermoactinomyces sp. DSM 45892]